MKPLYPLAILAALIGAPVLADNAYQAPQNLVPPSAFKGVHGLAVDHKGRLLAGSGTRYSVSADPALIERPDEVAPPLGATPIPGMPGTEKTCP